MSPLKKQLTFGVPLVGNRILRTLLHLMLLTGMPLIITILVIYFNSNTLIGSQPYPFG
jgi:hypothetical protein